MKAIETNYKGYRFRSRLEARWAIFWDSLGVVYEYEKEGFYLDQAGKYLPDFWLPEFNCWVEIKGDRCNVSTEDTLKVFALAKESSKMVFIFFQCQPFVSIRGEFSGGGRYYAPDGDFDGIMEFGICPVCEELTIGHHGDHQMFTNNQVYERPTDCIATCKDGDPTNHPRLLAAYAAARSARFEHGEYGAPH